MARDKEDYLLINTLLLRRYCSLSGLSILPPLNFIFGGSEQNKNLRGALLSENSQMPADGIAWNYSLLNTGNSDGFQRYQGLLGCHSSGCLKNMRKHSMGFSYQPFIKSFELIIIPSFNAYLGNGSVSVGELLCSSGTILREFLFQINPGRCLKVLMV